MKERPIMFSAPMVRAILNGTKTQTRRVMKPQPLLSRNGEWWHWPQYAGVAYWPQRINPASSEWSSERLFKKCPYGQPGDRLWVRETWQINHIDYDHVPIPKHHPIDLHGPVELIYRADGEFSQQFEIDEGGSVWRPSIHMPHWASRITLEITDVRVERVQDISYDDCCAETGAPDWSGPGPEPYRRNMHEVFKTLWDSINAKRGYGWDANPWVWVLTFRRAA